jgi:NAD+ kinase
MHSVGIVLHPQRDSAEAVDAILGWAEQRSIEVLGIVSEISRLHCAAVGVTPEDQQRAPVLGVNLGKLGFLAEIDVPELPDALSAVDAKNYSSEPRLAVDTVLGGKTVTAFNDIVVVRVPGNGSAAVSIRIDEESFIRYLADAVVVATPTGSTAYSFSAGGPIMNPLIEALLVTPVAPHSAYNRGLVLSVDDTLALDILPESGELAVEVDGQVAGRLVGGQCIELRPRPGAARVIRLGRMNFYDRARRKLRVTDSAEIRASL